MQLPRLSAAFALALLVAGPVAAQQYYDRPPAGFQDDGPVDAPDGAGLAIRVGKLESRIREMTGQIEELQNANRKLIEQLTRFQGDVDSRLSSGAPPRVKRSEAAPIPTESGAAMEADAGTPPARKHRDDAFDPDKAAASDPGRPKPLGSTPPNPPVEAENAPMDLSGGKLRREAAAPSSDTLAPTLRLPSASSPAATSNGTVVANAGPVVPQSDYEIALGFYRDKQYENAEKGFAAFIDKNPRSKRVADATYYLGESFTQRGRNREAAEQYLKVSTDYSSSARAPDAMLHLGISLKALGAKEQACAAFSEIPHKYPNAPTYVRSGAEREAKRAQCAS